MCKDIRQLATRFKPLTNEVNDVDHLICETVKPWFLLPELQNYTATAQRMSQSA